MTWPERLGALSWVTLPIASAIALVTQQAWHSDGKLKSSESATSFLSSRLPIPCNHRYLPYPNVFAVLFVPQDIPDRSLQFQAWMGSRVEGPAPSGLSPFLVM